MGGKNGKLLFVFLPPIILGYIPYKTNDNWFINRQVLISVYFNILNKI